MNINMEQADQLIETVGLDDLVEDYEHDERGHVYHLQNGDTAIVPDDGRILQIIPASN